jgi:hypothetical protein
MEPHHAEGLNLIQFLSTYVHAVLRSEINLSLVSEITSQLANLLETRIIAALRKSGLPIVPVMVLFKTANSRKKLARRFVGGVLGDEFAGDGAGEDRLAQPLGALEVGVDRLLHLLDDRQPALDHGDDAVPFGEGRYRCWKTGKIVIGQVSAITQLVRLVASREDPISPEVYLVPARLSQQ